MAIARITKNTSIPDNSTLHNEVSQRIQTYIRTYIFPLHKAGKVFTEKSILDRIKVRLSQDFEIMGEDSVLALVQKALGNVNQIL